jgi:hypothetical protein
MRRFPALAVCVALVALPVGARAAVPDPRVAGMLVGGTGPTSVATAIGDVTGDGTPDLIVARGADAGADAYTVAVFEGPLAATLPTVPTFTVTPSAASDAYRLAVGDLDHDGSGDLAVADVAGVPAAGIDVFLESGGSLPSTPSATMAPIPVLDLAVADMNGDAWDDLLFSRTTAGPNEVRLRAQQSDGSFVAGTVVVADASATGLSVGDVNNDGLRDFSLDGTLSSAVPVFVQSGLDHSFSLVDVTLPVELTSVSGAVLADVDDDTNDDVLVITDADALAWSLADGSGGFGAFTTLTGADAASAKEVADLNGDGMIDLATFGADGLLRIYLQQEAGGLGSACSFPGPDTPGTDAATAAGDLTADGAADLVDADIGGATGGAWLYRQLTGTELLPTSVDAIASKASMRVGKTVTISGTFANPGGGCLREDTVSLTRTGSAGSVDLGSTTIAGDGSFSFQDTPSKAGDYDYVASFAGDGTHEPAPSAALPLSVTRIPTSLQLAVTRSTITYRDETRLVATLTGGVASSVVAFQKAVQGTWKTIDTVEVGDDGVARLRVGPSAETRYRASFAATPNRLASVSTGLTVRVHPLMIGRMIGGGVRDGAYTIYPCCQAYFYVKLLPLHPGVQWKATVQYYGNGKWRPLGSGTYRIERDGDAAIFLNAVTGYRYRVRGHFAGDGDHLSATTAWNYFKYR